MSIARPRGGAARRASPTAWPGVIGGAERAVSSPTIARVPLVSATGSTQMGKALAPRIAGRLGRTLLELGGNNAAIVAPSADLDLVVRGSSSPPSAQPASAARASPADRPRVDRGRGRGAGSPPPTASVPIGDPREQGTLVGPLVSERLGRATRGGARRGRADGGEVVAGGERALADDGPTRGTRPRRSCGCRAQSSVVERGDIRAHSSTCSRIRDLEEAIAIQNGVPQGLASSIFTTDLREAERFLAAAAPTAASRT